MHTDLVVAPVSGPPRGLQTPVAADGGSYEGITVADGRIVWMHPITDATGHAHYTLWTAALSGGPATEGTADTGEAVFYNSGYDIQVVAGRIYWAANRPGNDGRPNYAPSPSPAAGSARSFSRAVGNCPRGRGWSPP